MIKSQIVQNSLKRFLILVLPYCLWIFSLRDILVRRLVLINDGLGYCRSINFYIDNILRLVYPLWNPFKNFGKPQDLTFRFFGEFNPFLSFMMALKFFGISDLTAYAIYLAAYYFVGLLGFYFLARRVLQDERVSYIAYLLLMFSSLGITFFADFGIILLFVPIVWFFFFLVGFTQGQQRRYFLGMIFSLMVVMVTYIPFYFLTIFLIFTVLFLILYAGQSKEIMRRYGQFIQKHKMCVLLSFLLLCLSVAPGFLWYMDGASGNVLDVHRHANSPNQHAATMSLETIAAGGVYGSLTLRSIFSLLSSRTISDHLLYSLPIFLYIGLLVSLFNNINKKILLFAGMFLIAILIALTDLTVIHGFLYRHVFFFRMFRNVFYLAYLVIPVFVLLVAEQLRITLSVCPRTKIKKLILVAFFGCIHLGFAFFLYQLDDIIISSYLTIFFSFVLFSLFAFVPSLREKKLFIVLFILLILMQPLEVLFHVNKNSRIYSLDYVHREVKPTFYYRQFEEGKGMRPADPNFLVKNRPVIDKSSYYGVPWSYVLYNSIPEEIVLDYVNDKFLIYDHVESLQNGGEGFVALKEALASRRNVAFVSTGDISLEDEQSRIQGPAQAKVILGDSFEFKVLEYDLNFIKMKTNFRTKKFLVYNDSYHPQWKATINGKKTKLFRANYAFKGLWIPSGKNIVAMRYGPQWLPALYFLLIGVFNLFFLYLLTAFIKPLFIEGALLAEET